MAIGHTPHPARRIARATLFTFRDQTARIQSPRFWRLLYWVFERDSTVRVTAALCRQAARRLSGLTEHSAADRIAHLFLTGWPHHRGTHWVNLNIARFVWRVKRSPGVGPSAKQRSAVTREQLRVGLLANLATTLTFSPPFFRQHPQGVELVALDLGGRERSVGYLEGLTTGYAAFDAADTEEIAAMIREADLDLLLFDVYKADLDSILDRVTVPCVVDVCTTVNLRFHPSVSFHLYCLQQADYLVQDHRLFCATSEAPFDQRLIYPGALLFDRRNLDPSNRRTWREREPLIIYHGKLYKLSASYLTAVLQLLADDSELQLVVMGRDNGHVERIRTAAHGQGVADQVHYEGEFRVARNEKGEVDDPSWLRLSDLLSRARLAPDPWPLAGAYSRIEAYAAGAPVIHMGIRSDEASWRRPQLAVTADHPALEIAGATAYTVEDYLALARRALYDEEFADAVAHEQAQRAVELTDGTRFWTQIMTCYRDWRTATDAR